MDDWGRVGRSSGGGKRVRVRGVGRIGARPIDATASLNHCEPGLLALRWLRFDLLTSTGQRFGKVRIALFSFDLAMQFSQLFRVVVAMASGNFAATGQFLAKDPSLLPSQSGEVLSSLNMWALDPSSVELCVHERRIGGFHLDANLAMTRITIVELGVPVPEVLNLAL